MTVVRSTDTGEHTPAQDIEFLIREAMRQRATKTAYPKIVKALWRLGLKNDEVSRILYLLDYADSNGEPYRWIFEKKKSA